MHLNHPETIPSLSLPVCGNIVLHETGPWCPKGWEPPSGNSLDPGARVVFVSVWL